MSYSLKPKLILVVDDDPDMRLFIGTTLDELGYHVVFANDGREALGQIDSQVFDLIVLDVMMPNLNGLVLLDAIKKNQDTKEIPVIMASGREDAKTWAATVNLGAKKYLHKPFSAIDLVAAVEKLIGGPRHE